jgi:hypothetical protein
MNAGFASPLFLLGFASDERVFIDIPGLEYTMPDNKLHFALPINRLHFTFPDEDR